MYDPDLYSRMTNMFEVSSADSLKNLHDLSGSRVSRDTSLFSSSLPVLHEKYLADLDLPRVELPKSDDPCDGDIQNNVLEDDGFNTVGSFLPDDEDELLSGIMDDFDLSGLPSQLEDLEDDDVFGSVGGMEMDGDPNEILTGLSNISISNGVTGTTACHFGLTNGMGTVAGEHPYGEHPSRTLFVRNINSNVEDSELRSLFEQYGDIRTLYTACKHRGFVMISYYDIRAARTAMRALQNKPLRRRKLDIHFSIPKDNPSEKDINQGTLVVFNLDVSVTNEDLRQIFGVYGEIKEIRETPHKRHHKFIEFYDVRGAEAALRALNRSDIAGKRIKLEPSRPGGARRNLMHQLTQDSEQEEVHSCCPQMGSPITSSPPGSWPHLSSPVEPNPLQSFSLSHVSSNHIPGLASVLPPYASNSMKISPIGKYPGRVTGSHVHTNPPVIRGGTYQHSHSYPEQSLGSSPEPLFFSESNSTSSGFGTLSGTQFLWGGPTIPTDSSSSSVWPSSAMPHPHVFPIANRHGPFLGSHHQNAGSAPSGAPPMDVHFRYIPESPETQFPTSGSLGRIAMSSNNLMNMSGHVPLGPISIPVIGSPNFRMMPFPRPNPVFHGSGFLDTDAMSNEIFGEHIKSRRIECNVSQIDNKQYHLDLDKINNGEDARTTLMIKNIPNKYTSKMLLAAIDEKHRGVYDFLYLPIDFKNKCNVGYAFINMVSPTHIIPFYKEFHGSKWEKFNSEKVASLAYARIQGKPALIMHFQNSSLMNEDKRCRPILFQSDDIDEKDLDNQNVMNTSTN